MINTELLLAAWLEKLQKKWDTEEYYYDVEEAKKVFKFVSKLTNDRGASRNFDLLEFQFEIITEILCVKRRSDGKRKHREAHINIPRKNGKSFLAAIIVVYLFFCQRHIFGALFILTANTTKQAGELYGTVEHFIKANKTLRRYCKITSSTKTIIRKDNGNKLMVLSSDADNADSFNDYVAVLDEIHQAKNDEMYGKLRTGQGAWDEPLIMTITTASSGEDPANPEMQLYTMAKKIEAGEVNDPSFYYRIYEADKDCNVEDETQWYKSNPALGVFRKLEDLANYAKRIEADISIDDVVTRIIPVSYNGHTLEGEEPWIDSPLIGSYANPRTAVIKFEDVKLLEDCQEGEEGFSTLELLREELKRRCTKEYENGLDKPKVNYKVDLVEVANTEDYKDYKKLTTVGIGDDVLTKDRKLKINVTARCIRLVYDCIEEENAEVELGNFIENYFDKTTSAADIIQKVTREDGTLKAEEVYGKIDAVKAQLKAQRDISQPSEVRAVIFEDLVEGSPTYGAMSIGTMGFCIASERTADGKDWDWKTFGTGRGFYADYICVGQLDGALIKADSIQAESISINYKKSVESHISEAVNTVERNYKNDIDGLKSDFKKTYTTFQYVDETAGNLANEAESNANSYTEEKLKKYVTQVSMNTAIEQSAESVKTYAKKAVNELKHNYVENGTFESGNLDGWDLSDSNNIKAINDEYLGNVASITRGTSNIYMRQSWKLKAGTYTVRFKAGANLRSISKARIRVSLGGTSYYTKAGELDDEVFKQYETEITISAAGTKYLYVYNYVDNTTVYIKDVEVLGKYEDHAEAQFTVANGAIEAEVKRAEGIEDELRSAIKVNANNITSKVEKGDMGSYVTQYYNNVLVAFNNSSKYVQISAGQIAIYNGEVTTKGKRAVFNQSGNSFYRDDYFVGRIGTNEWKSNSAHKGLTFDLEYQGKYMAWAQEESSSATSYDTILCYSRANSIYTEKGLHFGCNVYAHGWNLYNADLRNTSYDGYSSWTGEIPIITKIQANSDGTITWWSSSITVRNGGITSAPRS